MADISACEVCCPTHLLDQNVCHEPFSFRVLFYFLPGYFSIYHSLLRHLHGSLRHTYCVCVLFTLAVVEWSKLVQ